PARPPCGRQWNRPHHGGTDEMARSRTNAGGSWDDHDQSLRDQADDFEDELRAEMVQSGLIADW
ncbi:hypothetical protein, partial [Microbacterium ureisolvens]|uniref:hypothetical protein n=1 Tax=Microbacterium ureisolvens TaxID=2781186 RepID=UPI001C6E1265